MFGDRVRKLRELEGLSQAGLEKLTGIKREYISKLENNELNNPTINTVRRLAAALKVPSASLLDEPNTGLEEMELKALALINENQYLKSILEKIKNLALESAL